MANFLYTSVDPKGVSTTGNVVADSVAEARNALESQGHTRIEFLTGDLEAAFDEQLAATDERAVAPADVLTPKQQLEARRRGSRQWQTRRKTRCRRWAGSSASQRP